MFRRNSKTAIAGYSAALLSAVGLALAAPGASLALPGMSDITQDDGTVLPFTPAKVDPALAQRVNARLASLGTNMRFTPAAKSSANRERMATIAVRVDDQTARAISVRGAISAAKTNAGKASSGVDVASVRYNLGAARGYDSFIKPVVQPRNVRSIDNMPDLAEFAPATAAEDKPSAFQPRIALDDDARNTTVGRSRGTLEALGEQRVDVGGAYRVTNNLNVTAGVRLSQDRNRLAPLTDGVADSQAVYVGTQLRF